jgi:hypothetical protein
MKPYILEWKLYFWKKTAIAPRGAVIKLLPDGLVDNILKAHNGIPTLVELVAENPDCLDFVDIKLQKNFLNVYRQERRKYLAQHEKKQVAGISMGHVSSGPDNRYTHEFCNLPKDIYEKVDNEENLTSQELIEAISAASFLSREEKHPYVRLAIKKMDTLRILLMVLWETKSLDDKKYIALSVKLDEAGKMLGGWNGQLTKQNSPIK